MSLGEAGVPRNGRLTTYFPQSIALEFEKLGLTLACRTPTPLQMNSKNVRLISYLMLLTKPLGYMHQVLIYKMQDF